MNRKTEIDDLADAAVRWMIRTKEQQARAEKAEKERDEARAAMAELAPAEVCVRGDWFKPSELPEVLGRVMDARDEAQRDAKRYYLRAGQPRALGLSGVDLDMTRRAMRVLHGMGYMATEATTADALAAALTEPPARPEGAEELAPVVEQMLETYWSGDLNGEDVPDFLAERGVRVITEEES